MRGGECALPVPGPAPARGTARRTRDGDTDEPRELAYPLVDVGVGVVAAPMAAVVAICAASPPEPIELVRAVRGVVGDERLAIECGSDEWGAANEANDASEAVDDELDMVLLGPIAEARAS